MRFPVENRKMAETATKAWWAKCPLYAALMCALAPAATGQTVPSAQPVNLQEVLLDTVGSEAWVRFRFVAPQITQADDYEQTAEDMIHLCTQLALPYIAEYELTADVIVISLGDRATEFGVADPDATQFFEAFRPVDNNCMWEDL